MTEVPPNPPIAAGRPAAPRPMFLVAMGLLVRLIMIVPVVATFLTALALMVFGAIETWRFVAAMFFGAHAMERNEALLLAIEIVDLFLLATVVQVVSLGLYQLYLAEDRFPRRSQIQACRRHGDGARRIFPRPGDRLDR